MSRIRNVPYWTESRRHFCDHNFPSTNIDFLIIGGELYGISMMYWLSRLFPKSTSLLLEKSYIGARNSSRSLGAVNVIPDGSVHSHEVDHFLNRVRLSYQNRDLLVKFLSQYDMCGAIRNGGIHVATNDSEMAQIETIHRTLVENGYRCEHLSSKEITDLTDGINFMGGIYHPAEFIIDPYCLIYLMANICTENENNSILDQTNVIHIEDQGTHVEVITDTGNTIRSSMAILCNNELASQLSPDILETYMNNGIQRSQTVATNPIKAASKLTQLSCRIVGGDHGWVIQDNCMLHTIRKQSMASLDHYSYDTNDLKASSVFLGQHFTSLLKKTPRHNVWSDYYINMKNLLPITTNKSTNIIYNVGYDYSWMDLFFIMARRIAESVKNNQPINLN